MYSTDILDKIASSSELLVSGMAIMVPKVSRGDSHENTPKPIVINASNNKTIFNRFLIFFLEIGFPKGIENKFETCVNVSLFSDNEIDRSSPPRIGTLLETLIK